VQILGGGPAAQLLALKHIAACSGEGLGLVARDGHKQLAADGVAGLAGLLSAQPLDQRRVVAHRSDRKVEPALRVAAVGLGRQDAGAGVGGAALVLAVDQQRARTGAGQVIGRRYAGDPAADHDRVIGHSQLQNCGTREPGNHRTTEPQNHGTEDRG
jgi:hypothetical protein